MPFPSSRMHNLEAEVATLGAVLLENSQFDIVFERIKEKDFYDGRHQLIAKTILEYRSEKGDAIIDTLTLTNELTNKKILAKAGGAEYISSLIEAVPSTANVEYYVNIVLEKSLLRSIQNSHQNFKQYIDDSTLPSKEILDKMQSDLYVLEKGEYQSYENIDALVEQNIDRMAQIHEQIGNTQCIGVPTGYRELDKIISGFQESHFIVLGGRPGMGKTAIMTSLAQNIAINNKEGSGAVGIFSIEMTKEELCRRVLFAEAKIDSNFFAQGKMQSEHWTMLTKAASKLMGQEEITPQLYIDDMARTLQEIRSKAKRMVRENGVKVIFIDYLQIIVPDDPRIPREQQISIISRDLKRLANELKIPIIALTQLSREVEKRPDKKPQLSDLRESGAIEQDADIVMFIYRESYYLQQKISDKIKELEKGGEGNVNLELNAEAASKRELQVEAEREKAKQIEKLATVFIRKNRHGATGEMYLQFQYNYFRFNNLAQEDYGKARDLLQ